MRPGIEAMTDAPRKQGFRPDIQGLRAISVLIVVLYHSGVTALSGGYVGVDVFFVISGFLISMHLLESLESSGRIHFAQFYARRARRILPAALSVAALSVIAAWIWMPPPLMSEVVKGAIATALYVPNILFAVEGTNYLTEATPSLFQHYWSLGIEEQFYLAWPAFMMLGFWAGRRSERRLMFFAIVATACSFAACILMTYFIQPWAFFSLPTRAWELGVGALLAFIVRADPKWLSQPIAAIFSWLGLAVLLVVAYTFSETTPFPGWAAALPVAGAALLIIGGAASGGAGASKLLSAPPLQFVGKISYSLYLVHWPLQVIPDASNFASASLPLWLRLALGGAAFPVAWLVYRYIERPAMRWRPRAARPNLWTGALAAGVSSLLIVSSGALYLQSSATKLSSDQTIVAGATLGRSPAGAPFVPANLTPSIRLAVDDNADVYSSGCHLESSEDDPGGCQVGENSDAPLVFLFGDSHSASWYPALEKLAQDGIIRLDSNTKSSCHSIDLPQLFSGVPYTSCDNWRDGVIDRINAEQPDLVILANYNNEDTALADSSASLPARWQAGLESTITQISGPKVAIMKDVPDHIHSPRLCLSVNLETAGNCATPRQLSFQENLAEAEAAAAANTNAYQVDLTDYLCNDVDCPQIIDNIMVYRDNHHLTATFSQQMAYPLWREVEPLIF